MHDSKLADFPWLRFSEFISLETDRFQLLKELLEAAALDFSVLELAGSRHLMITPPPPDEEYRRRPPVILVAHYDRAAGSPGANDNSAAVFMLLEAALRLKKNNAINWIVIFTDKEELKKGESIQEQGSFALATGLKSVKMTEKAKIFCFDACGAGDTLIVSSTVEYLLKKEGGGEKIRESILELRKLALDTAGSLGMEKVLLSPVPFSDDAGFFRAGLAAQTITVLPSAECTQLISELRKNQEFAEVLISAESRESSRSKTIPETWRRLNTPNDTYIRLTPGHFRTWTRFAEALCK